MKSCSARGAGLLFYISMKMSRLKVPFFLNNACGYQIPQKRHRFSVFHNHVRILADWKISGTIHLLTRHSRGIPDGIPGNAAAFPGLLQECRHAAFPRHSRHLTTGIPGNAAAFPRHSRGIARHSRGIPAASFDIPLQLQY